MLDIDYQPQQGCTRDKTYQTLSPKQPLNHWVYTFWQLSVPAGEYHYRSMPDNCVDWIFNLDNPQESFVITPFTRSLVFPLQGPVRYFGIRFGILGYRGVIDSPLGEWNVGNDSLDAADVIPGQLLFEVQNNLAANADFMQHCANLSQILLKSVRHKDEDSRLARYIRYAIQNTASGIDLSDRQCAEFGLSARQLRRLSHLYLGLTPREFNKVIRFQKTVQLINSRSRPDWLNHFYDQPHFCREFKAISGMTLSEFRTLSVLYNTASA